MTIRRALLGDAAAIASVHVASWRGAYAGVLPQSALARNTVERRRANWDGVLATAARDVFVAIEAGEVIGFASGGAMPASTRERAPIPGYDAYVDTLYVLPARHGRGIGRALLGTLAQRLAARGFGSLALHVAAESPARRFYERLGARFIRAEPFVVDGVGEGVQIAYGWREISSVPTGTSVDGSTAGR